MATQSPRRRSSRTTSGKARRGKKDPEPKQTAGVDLDEIAARAAELGITPKRVLWEFAAIAFADLRRIIQWSPDGPRIKPLNELSAADVAAIEDIIPGTDPAHPRVKLYDRKAALYAIARHLGMFPLPPRRHEEAAPQEEGEDPREFLARELARLAAGAAEK